MNLHSNNRSLTRRLATSLLTFALVLCAATVPVAAAVAADGVVNINDANQETLQLLPRVGPSVAQRIIDFREENGKFADPTDLMQVRGIGEKTFGLMEPHVATEGKTTLTEKVRVPRASSQDSGEKDSAKKSGVR